MRRWMVVICFLVLSTAAAADVKAAVQFDVSKAVLTGYRLNAKDAAGLEATVAADANDLLARTKLLAYYFKKQDGSAAVRENRLKHVLWVIRHRPESGIAGLPECRLDPFDSKEGYAQASQLWREQVQAHPRSIPVLHNAANFFRTADPELALRYMEQVQSLEPANPRWADQLAALYRLHGRRPVESLAQYETAHSADNCDLTRFFRLPELARAAFEAGELEKAQQFSDQLLSAGKRYPTNWHFGNAVHYANNMIGLIALRKGQIEDAKQSLLRAGATPGSPQLDTAGPSMGLAKELLEKGEQDIVLQYLKLCRRFWTGHDGKLDDWTRQVKAGAIPEFGSDLM